jgi:chromosome transmission fidelity protein 18
MDFFGRPITVLASSRVKKAANGKKGGLMKPGVTYRYNEGNSAAVRKPVKVSSFLG